MDTQSFSKTGFVCQAIAAGWHHKSPEQLGELADAVGRDRIQVIHGSLDKMITLPHAEVLVEKLGGVESGVTRIVFEERGHVIPVEERSAFRRIVEDLVAKTEKLEK